jgi:hypothetical protein
MQTPASQTVDGDVLVQQPALVVGAVVTDLVLYTSSCRLR